MADNDTFRHGGVQFPLTDATTNTLLKDADPAIYYALDFFAAMLRTYLEERLLAQALLVGLRLPGAVAKTIHLEPSPFLLAHQFEFPLLALHRRSESNAQGTVSYTREISEWEFAYVLPSLNPIQLERLHPILRAASRIISQAAERGVDPAYNGGASAWDRAGIERARVVSASYGVYEPIDENHASFRALVGKIDVLEYDKPVDDTYEILDGVTANVDLQMTDATIVPDVARASTYPTPTLTTITPNLGTKAGGTSVTLTGTGFRVGTSVRVRVGGSYCSSVAVVSTTTVTAVTSAHAGYPDFMADVVVTADDTQEATLPTAFTFTAP